MKLHAIQNGNGDKNGELFGNELNSACKQQRYCKGTNFRISIWSKLKIIKKNIKKALTSSQEESKHLNLLF